MYKAIHKMLHAPLPETYFSIFQNRKAGTKAPIHKRNSKRKARARMARKSRRINRR